MTIIGPTSCQWGAVLGASLAAALCDCRSQRIPNRLTLPFALAGLAVAFAVGGRWQGLANAMGACLLLASPYVLLFLFAGGGAGDAKMMGAIGTWLGLEAGIVVLVAVAATGAVMGLVNIVANHPGRSPLRDLAAAAYVFLIALASGRKEGPPRVTEAGEACPAERRRGTIPYGAAIFIGVCIGAGVVHLWKA